MKRLILAIMFCASVVLFTSCESCVRDTAKKVTNLGLSAIEGISEAFDEKGEQASEKAVDALGAIAKGAGRSLERQLDEHAEHVASVVGSTFVQSIDGFEDGLLDEYYSEIPCTTKLPAGVSLDFFGKINSKDVIDAYFIILEGGTYPCKAEFVDVDGEVLMTREATIEKEAANERRFSVVSFALNKSESRLFSQTKNVKITVAKK